MIVVDARADNCLETSGGGTQPTGYYSHMITLAIEDQPKAQHARTDLAIAVNDVPKPAGGMLHRAVIRDTYIVGYSDEAVETANRAPIQQFQANESCAGFGISADRLCPPNGRIEAQESLESLNRVRTPRFGHPVQSNELRILGHGPYHVRVHHALCPSPDPCHGPALRPSSCSWAWVRHQQGGYREGEHRAGRSSGCCCRG